MGSGMYDIAVAIAGVGLAYLALDYGNLYCGIGAVIYLLSIGNRD